MPSPSLTTLHKTTHTRPHTPQKQNTQNTVTPLSWVTGLLVQPLLKVVVHGLSKMLGTLPLNRKSCLPFLSSLSLSTFPLPPFSLAYLPISTDRSIWATHLSIYLAIYLSICLSIYLSTALPIYVPIYLPIYLYTHTYIHTYIQRNGLIFNNTAANGGGFYCTSGNVGLADDVEFRKNAATTGKAVDDSWQRINK